MMRVYSLLLAISLLWGFVASDTVISGRQDDAVPVETLSLDELYDLAVAEGGQLVVRAGGDEKNQQASTVQAFQERFPKINITLTVDLSKYHDSVIDRTLNLTGSAGTDVAHLQTLHDFIRWKEEGRLLSYKPAGWDQIPDNIKDAADATFLGIVFLFFTNNFATAKTNVSEAPTEFLDYLDPKWKGKIVSTYPNDDDAVLFEFFKIQQTHGWDAIFSFIAQDVLWVRGTATPTTIILDNNNDRTVTFTTENAFTNGSSGVFQQLPKSDFSGSIIWAQRAAIFKTAEHPHAAKLYLNWFISKEHQASLGGWSVRNDVPQQAGLKPLSELSGFDPAAFEPFMIDRNLVERFRFQFEQLIGTAQGLSPLDDDI